MQSMAHRNLLPKITDRVYKLTNNTQEKCYFKLESVNC
jgi:hypothetical protein